MLLALLLLAFAAPPELLKLAGDLERVHDPVIAEENGRFYVFSTDRVPAGHLPIRCSSDLREWKLCGVVFPELPAWVKRTIAGARVLWAPDISKVDGRWYLYYSASTFGSNRSAIGLAINKTLDPGSPDYAWIDQGPVIQSYKENGFNCIDPNLVLEDDGSAWLVFGSYWSGIKMRRIDRKTGKLDESDTNLYSLANRQRVAGTHGSIEAPFVVRHGGFYYLFVSFDFCCRGANSTYKIAVGRAKTLTGPYVDRDGKPLLEGGGTILLEGTADWRGPGHNGFLRRPGGDLLVFHAYSAATGRPFLHISTVVWEDGWPRVAPLP